jgi:hypothetical protein
MPRGSDDARLIAVADRLDKLEASDGPQGPDLLHLLEGCRRLRAVLRGTD